MTKTQLSKTKLVNSYQMALKSDVMGDVE